MGSEELSSNFLFLFAVNQCIFSLMYQQSVYLLYSYIIVVELKVVHRFPNL